MSPEIATIAQSLGVDITDWRSCGMHGTSDAEQLAFAASQGRCIVTQDCWDFRRLTRLAREQGVPHAGVICVKQSFPVWDFAAVAAALARFAADHPAGLAPYTSVRLQRVS